MHLAYRRLTPQFRPLAAITAVLVLAVWAMTAVGCNTTQGAGKDIENLGEGIQDAAD